MSKTDDQPGHSTDPRIGTVVDKRYRLIERLGAGGMAVVYRAEHLGLRTEVALKLVNPGPSDAIRRRFEREAFVGARIKHDSIAAATDFGELEDGTLYLAMELLEGENLGQVLERGERIEPLRALRITRDVAVALGATHAADVVHRDIKPENIHLGDGGGAGDRVRLIDFGIAALSEKLGDAVADDKLTVAGTAFGTPRYIAPEQALGKDVDGRADLYSLTIVLYELLAGSPPFNADDPLKVAAKQVTQEPPSLAVQLPDTKLPQRLFDLVDSGLAKEPDKRHRDAAEYIAAIDAVLDEIAAAAAAPSGSHSIAAASPAGTVALPARDAQSPASRTKFAIAAAVGAVLLITIIAAAAGGGDDGDKSAKVDKVKPDESAAKAVIDTIRRIDDKELNKLVDELRGGRKCADRRQAVLKLRALGDPRAVPALRRARNRRVRGGFLNLQRKNANWCLKKDADAAIAELGGSL